MQEWQIRNNGKRVRVVWLVLSKSPKIGSSDCPKKSNPNSYNRSPRTSRFSRYKFHVSFIQSSQNHKSQRRKRNLLTYIYWQFSTLVRFSTSQSPQSIATLFRSVSCYPFMWFFFFNLTEKGSCFLYIAFFFWVYLMRLISLIYDFYRFNLIDDVREKSQENKDKLYFDFWGPCSAY